MTILQVSFILYHLFIYLYLNVKCYLFLLNFQYSLYIVCNFHGADEMFPPAQIFPFFPLDGQMDEQELNEPQNRVALIKGTYSFFVYTFMFILLYLLYIINILRPGWIFSPIYTTLSCNCMRSGHWTCRASYGALLRLAAIYGLELQEWSDTT